jgi:hypothetical protein
MKKNKKEAEGASIQISRSWFKIGGFQEWGEKTEQRQEKFVKRGPALMVYTLELFQGAKRFTYLAVFR